jgi:hypothetical protein
MFIMYGIQVDWQSTEFCYSPIVQSRSSSGGYDIRSTAESSSDLMAHKGVLLVAVGIRYKGYCTNVGRSFIVDPSKVSFLLTMPHPHSLNACIGTRGYPWSFNLLAKRDFDENKRRR